MGRYSKLWGTIGGSVLGVVFGILAFNGLAECTDAMNPTTCTAYGLSYAQVLGVSQLLLGAIGTYAAPANT